MKETIFHEIYYSVKRDWDGWLLGTVITGFTCYGIYWLSLNYDLNPIHWLSALGDYAYSRGGTTGFIAMTLCMTGVLVALILGSAWKGKQVLSDLERSNIKRQLEEVKSIQIGMKNLRQQLDDIHRNVAEVREILKTTE